MKQLGVRWPRFENRLMRYAPRCESQRQGNHHDIIQRSDHGEEFRNEVDW